MCVPYKSYGCLLICCLVLALTGVSAQDYNSWKINQVENNYIPQELKIIWCTININETKKCEGLKQANEQDQIRVGYDTLRIECKQAANKDECMRWLDQENATMTTLDAGEVFVGGRFHSLVPIAQEILEGNLNYYYAVSVIKSGTLTDVISLNDLKGKKACFSSVESYAGWMLPISTLLKQGIMEITDCNNHVKSASHFFGPSCAANCLTDRYNPIGDNSDKLCQLCTGVIPGGWCTDSDPFSGYDGALRCLLKKGDVAFLRHDTISDLLSTDEFSKLHKDEFELLCKDGSRRPLSDYQNCNWGQVPSNAIVVSSAVPFDVRSKYQQFLRKFAQTYSKNGRRNTESRKPEYDISSTSYPNNYDQERNRYDSFGSQNYDPYRNRFRRQSYERNDYQGFNSDHENNNHTTNLIYYEYFHLFESSPRYGDHGNLIFQDATIDIAPVSESMQTYEKFLGKTYDIIMEVRKCPVEKMTLCVTSDEEKNKCVKMKLALKAQLLKPELECYKGHSQINCMQAIRQGSADVTVLDASDVYTAGLNYDLVPFISEMYNLDDSDYYVVAVAKESDADTELTYLRTKNTCHGGISTAAGWVYPMAYLISNGWIRPYGCNSIRAAAEYFTKMCVPGAISTEYNTGVPYDNMCDLCHGASYRYCRRDASEDYYGHTGAFRCLVEGGGHVAFVKHTTIFENTGGKKREWWVRDNLMEDFELLCPDGTRAEANEYRKCNLGKVRANAIVTRGGYGYNEAHIDAFINLFMYAQRFYGRKTTDEFSFSMFSSDPPHSDLIFQDATTQLTVIDPGKRHYSAYLGPDFLRARRIVDCHAAAPIFYSTYVVVFVAYFFVSMLV